MPNPYAGEQLYKQKIAKLCTNQLFEDKNSLRIGWCYDPDLKKNRLAFYAHINQEIIPPPYPWPVNEPGREVTFLEKNINTNEWVHVEMAIGKKGMFMSIDGQSVIVSRNIFSWSPEGETTYFKAISYFEYGECDKGDCFGAVQDMDFYIENAIMDIPNFPWEKNTCEYTAENISFMNTNFEFTDQGPYNFFAGKSIYCSKKSSSQVTVSNLPYEAPFTVIEPEIIVNFTASNSIFLKKGFYAKSGSHFSARIQDVEKPIPVIILEEPEYLTPSVCYKVVNTNGFTFSLYKDASLNEWVSGGNGYIVGNKACYDIPNYEEIPNGKYYAVSLFSNECDTKSTEHFIFKVSKKIL